jgi:hypothetical protein
MAETALDLTLESVDSGSWHTERTLALVPEPTIEAPTMCDLAAGTRLHDSRLRVLERISDGACGVVYRGEHIDLRRPLAIKVLRGDMMGEGAREQFLDEARITGSISSPHVVQVVDFGELPDGRVWYAMELLGGRALDQVIAGGPIEASRAIDLLRMACKGLAAGHAAGFVHRDVKPQNLVLVERGGREHLVVVDFGIAVPIGTKPDSICGTPEYMAREQIIRDPLDPRTDVYALGCCAYELLTGKSLVGVCTLGQALLKHDLGIEPKFPAEANVPEALQAIVRRCLAVDPAQRYADRSRRRSFARGSGAAADRRGAPRSDRGRVRCAREATSAEATEQRARVVVRERGRDRGARRVAAGAGGEGCRHSARAAGRGGPRCDRADGAAGRATDDRGAGADGHRCAPRWRAEPRRGARRRGRGAGARFGDGRADLGADGASREQGGRSTLGERRRHRVVTRSRARRSTRAASG